MRDNHVAVALSGNQIEISIAAFSEERARSLYESIEQLLRYLSDYDGEAVESIADLMQGG